MQSRTWKAVGRWALVAAAVGMIAFVMPPPAPAGAHGETVTETLDPERLLGILGRKQGGRPGYPAEPTRPADRETPPPALVRPELVSATWRAGGHRLPLLVPDAALPWTFHVDRALAQRFGADAVIAAVRQWDGIPGSRWATRHAGLVTGGGAATDGRSIVFLRSGCPEDVGGYAHWQFDSAQPDWRYGTGAVYVSDVDIAICDSLRDVTQLREVVAHEVGHAFGLHHLCEPREDCWQAGMGSGPHHCRIMYAGGRLCRRQVEAIEHDAVVHLYPTLRRLSGPARVETAARASYAVFDAGSAQTVVVARADATAHGPLAAAALAGALKAPFLVGVPREDTCVSGATAEELSRVAGDRATVVLVGAWPNGCKRMLAKWRVVVERVDAESSIELGTALATRLSDSGQMGQAAVLVTNHAQGNGHIPDAVAGGAAAGAVAGPVLFTGSERLDARVREWLAQHSGIKRMYVLGGTAALSDRVIQDLAGLHVSAVRVGGSGRIETALALASRSEIFGASRPVVVATADHWADAVTGSALGGRTGSPVLLTSRDAVAGVESWLRQHAPRGGWVVGGAGVVTPDAQWRYGRFVR